MDAIFNPDIKSNSSVYKKENVNHPQFWKSNKQAISICDLR
jgi:hypothetical protein